jgi:catechol 2,3-dioxygenase-like lactoylglutathione lyase family enzyme
MTDHQDDAPPIAGGLKVIPELLVEDISSSVPFWCYVLGFAMTYRGPADDFVRLERPDGAQVTLAHRWGNWETGPMERPFGRGVVLQVYVDDLAPILKALARRAWPLVEGPRIVRRQDLGGEVLSHEIYVQDPNGYLVMIAQILGNHVEDSPADRTAARPTATGAEPAPATR